MKLGQIICIKMQQKLKTQQKQNALKNRKKLKKNFYEIERFEGGQPDKK